MTDHSAEYVRSQHTGRLHIAAADGLTVCGRRILLGERESRVTAADFVGADVCGDCHYRWLNPALNDGPECGS